MPQWVVLLGIAIFAWLALCVLGGLLVGRLFDAASRLAHRGGHEGDAFDDFQQPAPRRRAA